MLWIMLIQAVASDSIPSAVRYKIVRGLVNQSVRAGVRAVVIRSFLVLSNCPAPSDTYVLLSESNLKLCHLALAQHHSCSEVTVSCALSGTSFWCSLTATAAANSHYETTTSAPLLSRR
jgi:hypothetical protein